MALQWCIFLYLLYLTDGFYSQELEYKFNNKSGLAEASICDMCVCVEKIIDDQEDKVEIYCGSTVVGLKDFSSISWPENDKNLPIHAIFENVLLNAVQKIPENSGVVSLSFINNGLRSISPGAFSDVPNLKYLEISRNDITMITSDIFKNLNNLAVLNLSYNKLSDLKSMNFVVLNNLKFLDLSNNLLTKIPADSLQKLNHLEELNLSGNQIYFINTENTIGESLWIKNLKSLDLSYNKLSTIYLKGTFEEATHLEYLNLSSNAIVAMESNVLAECTSLKVLDVSNNALSDLPDLPSSVEVLYLHLNAFKKWPTLPSNIKALDFSRNNLYENFNENYVSFNMLEFLNISGNTLLNFEISRPLSNLKYLDLSCNMLPRIPQSLSTANLPKLSVLYLDGNPIDKLEFSSEIKLKKLSAKQLKNVISLDASSFSQVKVQISDELLENFDSSDDCLDIMISHCPNLREINDDTFQGVKLCHLDISYNNLSFIDENIAEWQYIRAGVNLQGNPWDCTCQFQWILDTILKDLYANHSSYLNDLRCASPRPFQGMRLVHWYNREEKTFCMEKYLSKYVVLESNEAEPVLLEGGAAVIGILVAIVIALILCVALIVYLIRGKYKHDHAVRRQMKKKRQAMTDAEMLNRTQYNQNEPLTVTTLPRN